MTPRVSVLIPTYNRPALVPRAVRSALDQTLREIEVIVIPDGPDAATMAALASIQDSRLRIEPLPSHAGQSAVLNFGAKLARAPWLAFLDDDDHWSPRKLEVQLQAAASNPNAIVGCRFIARGDRADLVWPRRAPRHGEPLSEYLFCRSSLAFGEGLMPTSALFVSSQLFRELPMNERLPNHIDLDWLCRASRQGAVLVLPTDPEPLAVWEMQQTRDRMSTNIDWRHSCDWAAGLGDAITPRAYAGFLLTWVSLFARRQRDTRAFAFLLREAFRRGRPNAIEILIHLGLWTVPAAAREKISERLNNKPA